MANELKLVELVAVKNAMNMPESELDKDVVIEDLILGVSRDFQETADRVVEIGAQSEVLDIEEFTNQLKLRAWPVDTEADFKIFHDTTRAFGAETEVDSAQYYLNPVNGKVDLFLKFAPGRKILKVTYTGGMASFTEPLVVGEEFWSLYPDVAEAVTLEVISTFKKIPNLGAAVVRIGQDWTQMRQLGDRTKRFKRIARSYGRMSI